MAHQQTPKARFRHRIQEIGLEPNKSAYEITLELFVDGKRAHKLPSVKKGLLLNWSNLHLPCDVSEDSTITLQITEVHPFRRRDRVEQVEYQIAQMANQNSVSVGCANGIFEVQVVFLDQELAKRAYSEALTRVQRLEKQPGVLGQTGRVARSFKALLTLGEMAADLDPTGSAKLVFAACTQAWEPAMTGKPATSCFSNTL
ncbi:hypothetical protein FS749_004408 [Ceratobasidium sp. UAMH 11750]|nr:hypothetical protein FS749_004408 [Ceratobasidium sp. UAMH 11750]